MLGGYIVLYPRAKILALVWIVIVVTIVKLPALLVLALWFVEQIAFTVLDVGTASPGGDGVAYFAHTAGSCSAC